MSRISHSIPPTVQRSHSGPPIDDTGRPPCRPRHQASDRTGLASRAAGSSPQARPHRILTRSEGRPKRDPERNTRSRVRDDSTDDQTEGQSEQAASLVHHVLHSHSPRRRLFQGYLAERPREDIAGTPEYSRNTTDRHVVLQDRCSSVPLVRPVRLAREERRLDMGDR